MAERKGFATHASVSELRSFGVTLALTLTGGYPARLHRRPHPGGPPAPAHPTSPTESVTLKNVIRLLP